MNKAYNPTTWRNEPSLDSPINEENLNHIENGIDTLDDRIILLDTTKATKTEIATMISNVSFNESTGIFTFTRKNGSTFTIDTKLEKIAVNFSYDYATQKLILTLIDGSTIEIDISSLIQQNEFVDTSTIDFSIDNTGKVKAIVKNGSITENHLRPDYLADIRVESANAEQSSSEALESERKAQSYAEQAEHYFDSMETLFDFSINQDGDLIMTKTV